mgnify:CR=1 FL=1
MHGGQRHSRRAFLLGRASSAPPRPDGYAKPDPDYGLLIYHKPLFTPNDHFYTVHLGVIPQVDLTRWALALDGMVARPLLLDWAAIQALPPVEVTRTLLNIGNPPGGPLIGNARWRGVALKPLLERAGVQREATHVRFYAADGYATSVALHGLATDAVVLAYEMNGAPLPAAQGYPLRALVPGLYDHKMPKWLTRVELADGPQTGYWERHGWSAVGAVKTVAMFRSPPDHATVRGAVYLQGVAFAGDRAIHRVEVSANEGPWLEAELVTPESALAWTQWAFRWQPEVPGSHGFRVRATDERGFTQHADSGRPFPNGADAIHRLTLTVAG